MYIHEAMAALLQRRDFLAVRVNGSILQLTPGNRIVELRGPKPRTFCPTLQDCCAMDWQVLTQEQFAQLLEKARAQAGAAA